MKFEATGSGQSSFHRRYAHRVIEVPLVSILTPSFNQGRFIGDCLRSVANQTYGNVEHVVMDGGSADETIDTLKAAQRPVRWTSEPDRGQSHALNKALAASQGEFIGWLNSDDAYVDRRSVACAVEVFQKHPEVGVVYGHSLVINAANRVLQFYWAPPAAERLLFTGLRYTQPSVFIRRSVLPDPFVREDLDYVMDRDLWLRLRGRTVFRRQDLVVGADRHHGDRKILSSGFEAEKVRYGAEGLEKVWPLPAWKATSLLFRQIGAAQMPWLRDRVEPAIDLRFDSALPMMRRQSLQRRRDMPED